MTSDRFRLHPWDSIRQDIQALSQSNNSILESTLTKEQFFEWAKGQGYRRGPYGHLQIEFKGVPFRFRLKADIAIFEKKSEFGWHRLRSGYFSSMSIIPDGRITGLKRERFYR